MIIDIKYEWIMNTSNSLSIIAYNIFKDISKIKHDEKYYQAIENTIFDIFNYSSEIQKLDNGAIKRVVFDFTDNHIKESILMAFSTQLQEEFNNLKLNPSNEIIQNIIYSIEKELIKTSAINNNILLDSNLQPILPKIKTKEQETIFEYNNNVNVNDTVIQLQVEFKTGNLIITDMLKNPEIENIMKSIESGIGTLNDITGRHERTKRLAQSLNIISVSHGDVYPTIFNKKNILVFGSSIKENDFDDLGHIIGGFHGTSIYEKENLLNLLTESVGEIKANKILNNILNQSNVIQVNVSPGFYQLTLGDYFEDFSKDIKKYSVSIPNCTNIKPWFTLEKFDLILNFEKKNKKTI